MSRGATLLEMLIVCILLALLLGIGVPAIGALRDRLAVDGVTQSVLAAHQRARMVAVAERRVAILTLTADSMVIRAVESEEDTVVRWRGPGPSTERVTATGLPRSLWFAPSGVTMGVANGSYLLSRGGVSRQIIVSRYGRVRVI